MLSRFPTPNRLKGKKKNGAAAPKTENNISGDPNSILKNNTSHSLTKPVAGKAATPAPASGQAISINDVAPVKKPTEQAKTVSWVVKQIRDNQDKYRASEAETRKELINPILTAYGWHLNDPSEVRMEQGTAQPGRPDISLIDPEKKQSIAAIEAKKLGSPELNQKAVHQLTGYSDGSGKTNRIAILTDGDKWVFRRPGQNDDEKPLAEIQLSQDKPEEAMKTLTRVLRPAAIKGEKMEQELNNVKTIVEAAPDHRYNEYVVLDVETTGFSPERDKVIEFGAVKIINGKEVDSMQTFVNPGKPIPKAVKELTHIDDNMVKDAPQFGAVKGDIQRFIGNYPVVAHNASFDHRMLTAEGIQSNSEWYDTMKLSRWLYQDEDRHNLETITKRMGIYEEGTHRADQDARLTGKAFAVMMNDAAHMKADKRASILREASRKGQDPTVALLAGAGQASMRSAVASGPVNQPSTAPSGPPKAPQKPSGGIRPTSNPAPNKMKTMESMNQNVAMRSATKRPIAVK